MSKLLINDQNKALISNNGKAYAIGNMDALKGSSSPVNITAAAGKVLKLMRYGKCEQNGTPTPSVPVEIKCNNGTLRTVDDELPNEYKRITGITFDSSTYYNTNKKLYGSDVVTMTISDFVSAGQNLFGCYSGTGSDVYNFSLYIYGSSTGQAYWRYGKTLYRPTVGSTDTRTITFGAGGTTGFKTNATHSEVDFETTDVAWIGALPNSSSPKFEGTILGNITIGERLKYVPCERVSDGVIGYYEVVNGVFLEPNGSAPVAGSYDYSHLTVLAAAGTPESLTLGAQTASVENLFAVGNYVDKQDIISGKVMRKVGIKMFDGTENGWTFDSTYGRAIFRPLLNFNSTTTRNIAMLCTHFVSKYNAEPISELSVGDFYNATNSGLAFHISQTSLEDWKAYLAEQYTARTPVIVIYPLAEETSEQVAPQPLNTNIGLNLLTDIAEINNPEYNVIYKIQ